MHTLTTWKPTPGQQTAQLRAAGLKTEDLRAAGFSWARTQQWEAPATEQSLAIMARLNGGSAETQHATEATPTPTSTTQHNPPPVRASVAVGAAPSPATIAKARTLADKLDEEAENGERPREQHTQKKLAQAMHARLAAARCRRAASLLRAWADDPAHMPHWKPSKKDALEAVRRDLSMVANGYHSYHVETDKPSATTDSTINALRTHYGNTEEKPNPRAKIETFENALRFNPIPGFFPTPKSLISRMMELADLCAGQRVLEPSAGKGDLADEIRCHGVKVDCCEIAPRLREVLLAKGHHLISDDCLLHASNLEADQSAPYDRIIMNPPFENGQDAHHTRRMFDILAPGGRLVAVCSTGPFTRSFKSDIAFREWLDKVGAVVEDVEPGAFNGSDAFRKTGVNVKLLTIDK